MRPPPELEDTSYVHDYVSLLSRITFYWVSRLLVTGYRNPLERKDLGTLPPVRSTAYTGMSDFSLISDFVEKKGNWHKINHIWSNHGRNLNSIQV